MAVVTVASTFSTSPTHAAPTATATFKNEPRTAGAMLMSNVLRNSPARLLRSVAALRHDCRVRCRRVRFILPLMLVLFFGTVEFSSGVAATARSR